MGNLNNRKDVGVRGMIYINKFGVLKIKDEEDDDFDKEISEETIQIVDYWKSNEV